jgi:hypothetical protein
MAPDGIHAAGQVVPLSTLTGPVLRDRRQWMTSADNQ